MTPTPVCSVCLDESGLSKTLSCGHSFHEDCIDKWLEDNNTCPNCRKLTHPHIHFDEKCGPSIITQELIAKLIAVMVSVVEPCTIHVCPVGGISITTQSDH